MVKKSLLATGRENISEKRKGRKKDNNVFSLSICIRGGVHLLQLENCHVM